MFLGRMGNVGETHHGDFPQLFFGGMITVAEHTCKMILSGGRQARLAFTSRSLLPRAFNCWHHSDTAASKMSICFIFSIGKKAEE